MQLPELYLIKQEMSSPAIRDIPSAVTAELDTIGIRKNLTPGGSVAITAGSRGITFIDTVIRTAVDYLKAAGARPFIVPAMGSHGGGTGPGQLELLNSLGISPESMGCGITSSMDTVLTGKTLRDIPVYTGRHAAEADHILIINRIKPHTRFSGAVESGLVKMCLVGLGKADGARAIHEAASRYSWQETAESSMNVIGDKLHILGGLAIIENAENHIARLEGVLSKNFLKTEPALLDKARVLMGRIPFDSLDLLIVDKIGKDISGTGMDTTVIGKKSGSGINIKRIFVRDLTDTSDGNALGIGFADFTTERLVKKIDFDTMRLNAQTARREEAGEVPLTLSSDYDAVNIALEAGDKPADTQKIVWINSTLALNEIMVSKPLLREIGGQSPLHIRSGPHAMKFTAEGELIKPIIP